MGHVNGDRGLPDPARTSDGTDPDRPVSLCPVIIGLVVVGLGKEVGQPADLLGSAGELGDVRRQLGRAGSVPVAARRAVNVRAVVVGGRTCVAGGGCDAGRAPAASRAHQRLASLLRQPKRLGQQPHRAAVRPRRLARLHAADRPDAEAGKSREIFLRERRRAPEPAQQYAEALPFTDLTGTHRPAPEINNTIRTSQQHRRTSYRMSGIYYPRKL